MNVRRILKSLFALASGRRLDQDLDAEIAAHLELAEKEALDSGLPPAEARRQSRLRFGGVERVREDHRDRRSARWFETFLRDTRHGFANLMRDPSFAVVSIGVLALGIGANSAMFSLVDSTLLHPLPFPHVERLARVWEAPQPMTRNNVNTLDFLDWQRLNTVFEALTAESVASRALTGTGEPVRVDCRLVSSEYFDVFGVTPSRGRGFGPEDDDQGAAPVAVLGHAAWQNLFGGDPAVLGQAITLDRRPYTVIGILPPGVFDRVDADVFLPLVLSEDQQNRGFHWLRVTGRLKPGTSIEQAQQEMTALDTRLSDLSPDWKRDWGVTVEAFDARILGDDLRRSIAVTFGAVGLVLLIACANVTNLMLAKGAVRGKEMAVRAALGASRRRLVSQLLSESLVLCFLGGLASLGLAKLMLQAAIPMLADSLPFRPVIELDSRVLAFTAGATLLVAFVIGLLPAFQTSFVRLSQAINRQTRGSTGSSERLRRMIVIAEVAVSLVLTCSAALLFKSLMQLQEVDLGVRIENVVGMSVDLPKTMYPTPESAVRFYDEVVERLSAVPGVEAASVTTDLPMEGVPHGEGMRVPGREENIPLRYKRVDPHYFEALDIPVVAGRGIGAQDREGAPLAVVVNEELAARLEELLGSKSLVGQTVLLPLINYQMSSGSVEEYQVVGMARSERIAAPGEDMLPVAYIAMAQVPRSYFKIVVRGAGSPSALMAGVRQAMDQVDPSLPLGDVRTFEQVRQRSLSGARQPAWLIGAFALAAAFLAALGLYGVLSNAVAQQRRDIGVRMALGARAADVVSQVLRNAAAMVAMGVVLGLAGAFLATRLLQTLLFEVSAWDPVAIAAASLATAALSLSAGWLPARRAASVDPMHVLREDA